MKPEQSEQRMLNDAIKHIRASGEFRAADELAVKFGVDVEDLEARLKSWVVRREIFSVEDDNGAELFPMFALEGARGLRPNKAVANVLEILADRSSHWFIAGWFIAVNSYLDGQRPRDLLEVDPEWVIEAARDEIRECAHG